MKINKTIFFIFTLILLLGCMSSGEKIEEQAKKNKVDFSFLKGVSKMYLVEASLDDFQLGGKIVPEWVKEGEMKEGEWPYTTWEKIVDNFNEALVDRFVRLMEKENIEIKIIKKDKVPKKGIVLFLVLHGTDFQVVGVSSTTGGPITSAVYTSSITAKDMQNPPPKDRLPRMVITNSPGAWTFTPAFSAGKQAGKEYFEILMYFVNKE